MLRSVWSRAELPRAQYLKRNPSSDSAGSASRTPSMPKPSDTAGPRWSFVFSPFVRIRKPTIGALSGGVALDPLARIAARDLLEPSYLAASIQGNPLLALLACSEDRRSGPSPGG